MAKRWFYIHDGMPRGPISQQGLIQLAGTGDLGPGDLVWPQGSDPRRAVKAHSLLGSKAFGSGSAASGKWLGKVAEALDTPALPPGTPPDWLADVETAAAEPLASMESPPEATKAATTRSKRRKGRTDVPRKRSTQQGPVDAEAQAAAILESEPGFGSRLTLGSASSRGKVRQHNDDRFLSWQWSWNDADGVHEAALLVVADGRGGPDAGDMASNLTVRTIGNHLVRLVLAGKEADGVVIAPAIVQAIHEANRVVHQDATAEGRCAGMSATAAVVVIQGRRAYFGHVGDCRVSLHRNGQLVQLTQDQTLAARLVALGKLSEQEAAQHESAHEVAQAIGQRPAIQPSILDQELEPGDFLLVACAGLATQVEPPALEEILNAATVSAQDLASLLVSKADEHGGKDNCTVAIAHVNA